MGDMRTGTRRHQRGKAGIAEQIEQAHRTVRCGNFVLDETPMRRLLGKHADMTEGREAAEIGDAVPVERPGFAKLGLGETPAAHAVFLGIAGEDGVGLAPLARVERRAPQCLSFGPLDYIWAITLELAAVAAVKQRIAAVAGCLEDDRRRFRQAVLRGRAALRLRRRGGGMGSLVQLGLRPFANVSAQSPTLNRARTKPQC